MTFRALACCVTLVLGLLLTDSLGARYADACSGASCRTSAKPLDLMKFMQPSSKARHAAGARAKPRHGSRHADTQATRKQEPDVAQTTKPAPLPPVAPTAFASEPNATPGSEPDVAPQLDANVQVVSSDEFNAIDRAAGPAPTETSGAAVAGGQPVKFADVERFNKIDKAVQPDPPQPNRATTDNDNDSSTVAWILAMWASWSSWVWSSLSGAFAAVRQLFG